jgi:hypothetical protein
MKPMHGGVVTTLDEIQAWRLPVRGMFERVFLQEAVT